MTASVTLTDTQLLLAGCLVAWFYTAGAFLAATLAVVGRVNPDTGDEIELWRIVVVTVFWWLAALVLACRFAHHLLRGGWRPGISVPDEDDRADRETL